MAKYTNAIRWIVENEDTTWLDDAERLESTSALLVADVFLKSDSDVLADLKAEKARHVRKVSRTTAQGLRGNGYR